LVAVVSCLTSYHVQHLLPIFNAMKASPYSLDNTNPTPAIDVPERLWAARF
jgi:hypothetical protein